MSEPKIDFKLGTEEEAYWQKELDAIQKNIKHGNYALEVNAMLEEFFKKKVEETKLKK